MKRIFFVAELEVFLPATVATTTFTAGHGAKPHGTLSEFGQVDASAETLLVSDIGYRYISGTAVWDGFSWDDGSAWT